jgi:hypothetical protein
VPDVDKGGQLPLFALGLCGPEQVFNGGLRFESIIPMPLEISSKEDNDDAKISWCLEHWGFSGKYHVHEDEEDPERLRFELSTDGGARDKLFEPMARMFPELTFRIFTVRIFAVRASIRLGCETRWLLRDGRLIKVQSETELDADIRERLTAEMSEDDKKRLAEWCATQRNLFSRGRWARQIERVIRESAGQSQEEPATAEA